MSMSKAIPRDTESRSLSRSLGISRGGMVVKSIMKKRAILVVAIVFAAAILSILNIYDSGLIFVLNNRRPLGQLVDILSSKDDEDELSIPEWLTTPQGIDYIEFSGVNSRTVDDKPPLTPFTMEDILAASSLYQQAYGVLIYDPEDDDFKLFYNNKMPWKSSAAKMSSSFQLLTKLLRLSFPDRFQGKNSSELGKP